MSDTGNAVVLYNAGGTAAVSTVVDGALTRLAVTTVANTATTTPASVNSIRAVLLNAGSGNMQVAGTSATPKLFTFAGSASRNITITNIVTIMSTPTLYVRGQYFGYGTALTNGLLYGATSSGSALSLFTVKLNEDFLTYGGYDCFTNNANAYMTFNVPVNIPLVGTSDNISISVRDALNTYGLYFLQSAVMGYYTS